MRNANLVAMEFQSLMPLFDRPPEHTEKREGFIHLTQMSGLTEAAQLDYIIRDHDKTLFEAKKTNRAQCSRLSAKQIRR